MASLLALLLLCATAHGATRAVAPHLRGASPADTAVLPQPLEAVAPQPASVDAPPASPLAAPPPVGAASALVVGSAAGEAIRLWPTILLIGCGRCGSTTLYEMLRQHPDIVDTVPVGDDADWVRKEVEHWGRWPLPSLDYYLAHFPVPAERLADARSGQLRAMDASPSYSSLAVVPQRIRAAYPGAVAKQLRLLLILRRPADRFLSYFCRMLSADVHWGWMAEAMARLGLPTTADSLGALVRQGAEQIQRCQQQSNSYLVWKRCVWSGSALFDVLANGLFLDQLQHWLAEGFPLGQFLLTTTGDVREHPQAVMRSAFAFVGLPTSADPGKAPQMPWESRKRAVRANADERKCGRLSLPAAAVAQLDAFYAPHTAALGRWLRVHQQSLGGLRGEALADVESWAAGTPG